MELLRDDDLPAISYISMLNKEQKDCLSITGSFKLTPQVSPEVIVDISPLSDSHLEYFCVSIISFT